MYKIFKLKFSKQQLWLCLPVAFACVADATLTLLGQPPSYWYGGYQNVRETNALAHFFLSAHSETFAVYVLGELGMAALLIGFLPKIFSQILAVSLFLMHTVGAYLWLRNVYNVDYIVRQMLLFIPATLLVYAFAQVERNST